mgnify:CR=1 FL=1
MKKNLISICTFKEAENLKELLPAIRKYEINADILIVNDFSDDNTKSIIEKINDKKIIFIERDKKLGLGSAHKLSIIYSIQNNYDFLISMDADFSHDPKYIPELIKKSGKQKFVIGSRFCKGGKLDYKIIRKFVSYFGNKFATFMLNIPIKEVTTFYRVYDIELLKKIPLNKLKADGYSMGVELVWYMKKLGAEMHEVPIHFKDRNKGKSKLPKNQILISVFDLFKLKLIDIFNINIFKND